MRPRLVGMRHVIFALCAWLALGASPAATAQNSDIAIRDITRLDGLGTDRLWGMGLVFGLPGTGDSAKVRVKAHKLAALLQHAAVYMPDLEDALNSRSVAVVYVTAKLPEDATIVGDEYDVSVATMFDAKDLAGGMLFPTPMRGMDATDFEIYAMAQGLIQPDGSDVPTVGRIAKGARIRTSIFKPIIDDGTLTFHVRESHASNATTTLIASLINQDRQGLRADGAPPIARAVSGRSVVVTIPDEELVNPIRFAADLQKIRFDSSLLNYEPVVVINERAGVITITGNVVISDTVVSSSNLVVTTTIPEIPATIENPLIEQSNATVVGTPQATRSGARAQALLDALQKLQVPVAEQIEIFRNLDKAGALNAELRLI